ncbi:MAG: hypothetical protein HRT81_10255 [Henriciella sp.]|nr:hypothetical protein [Henriciella sp.]
MKLLRIWAVLLALSLMIVEVWRSWGAGRELVFVIDDQIMGAMLIASAYLLKQQTLRRRAFFSAAWAVNVGMLYGSFFGKVVNPADAEPGNWDVNILTGLIGLAFVSAIIGMIASIILPQQGSRYEQTG